MGAAGAARAQTEVAADDTAAAMPVVAVTSSTSVDALPDAPMPAQDAGDMQVARPGLKIAPRYDLYIGPKETSQSLDAKQKMLLAAYQSVNGNIFMTGLLSAGWSHLLNSDPKYGTDKGAFGQRYGAAILRETSQSIFAGGIGDVLLQDDPRYYILGRSHSILGRGLYSAERVFVTRADDGHQRVNLPLLIGYIGAAALTQTYYPSASQGATVVMKSYAASLGGSALGFEFHEFIGDALRITHIKKD